MAHASSHGAARTGSSGRMARAGHDTRPCGATHTRAGGRHLAVDVLQLLCVSACALALLPAPAGSAPSQVPPVPVGPSPVAPAPQRAEFSFSLLKKVSPGARCLDGSPPGYYYRRGYGTGKRNWLFFLPGGAWCYSPRSCRKRTHTLLGSSSLWPHPADPAFQTKLKRLTGYGFTGVLHGSAAVNPLMHNWHVVVVAYCDGAAFSGTRGRFNTSRTASLVAGGRSILKNVVRHVRVSRGLRRARRVVVAGCSAGAQAVAMQCDALSHLLPPGAVKRCIMDGGFFPDWRDMSGVYFLRKVAQRLVAMHNISGDSDCLRGEGPDSQWRCFFPEHGVRHVSTPLLVVNSVNDVDALTLLNLHSPNRRRLHRCLLSLAGRGKPQCSKEDAGTALAYTVRVAGLVKEAARRNPSVKKFLYHDRLHCATLENRWSSVQGDGGALRDVLNYFALS
ncbi:hypothetical protein CLOM_g23905 [Closterium sp. NIES-68]|nr:hypothetical protein CLOM_g23905 [Closterium sp. NIES-68]GJP58721.1 hypothetical protein CLOP_g3311 [Closterium sp. NIES-67]